jgi:hypothetical protein
MKKAKSSSNGKSEEFDNFDRLFRSVISVPKSAIEKEEVKERQRNQQKRERSKTAKKHP